MRASLNARHGQDKRYPKADNGNKVNSAPTLPQIRDVSLGLMVEMVNTETKRKCDRIWVSGVGIGTHGKGQQGGLRRLSDYRACAVCSIGNAGRHTTVMLNMGVGC